MSCHTLYGSANIQQIFETTFKGAAILTYIMIIAYTNDNFDLIH